MSSQLMERTPPAVEREKPLDTGMRRGSSPRKTVSSQGSAASDSSKKTEESLKEKERELQLSMVGASC